MKPSEIAGNFITNPPPLSCRPDISPEAKGNLAPLSAKQHGKSNKPNKPNKPNNWHLLIDKASARIRPLLERWMSGLSRTPGKRV